MSRQQLTSNIINSSCRLNLIQRHEVLKFLADNSVKINEASDGSRVNIDILDEGLLLKLNDMIVRMLTTIPERFRI